MILLIIAVIIAVFVLWKSFKAFKLPDNNITIETDSNYKTIITCEKAQFTIIGKSGEDFSYLPVIEKSNPFVKVEQIMQYKFNNTLLPENTKIGKII